MRETNKRAFFFVKQMHTHVALLRGINVGGHQKVSMAGLRDLLTKLGCSEVQTVLQSGNAIFQHERPPSLEFELWLEEEVNRRFKLQTEFLLRSAAEWRELILKNPFPKEATQDPAHLTAVLLKDLVSRENVEALQAAVRGPERVHGAGRQIYIFYPEGIGRSKLTGAVVEKRLNTRCTARNWNTVLKLETLCGPA